MSTAISRGQRTLPTTNSSVALNRTVGGNDTDRAYSLIETSDGGLAFAGSTASFGDGFDDAWVVKLNSSGDVVLNRTLGGSDRDRARSLIETGDGGLAFAGETESFGKGNDDAWVVKLNSSGDVVLNRTVGGSASDIGYSLIETSDGALAFAGSTQSFGSGSRDAWVVKLETQANSCESIAKAIDSNDDGKIGDFEVLDAIEHWRDSTEVPNTCGKTIGDFEVLDLIKTWRINSDV